MKIKPENHSKDNIHKSPKGKANNQQLGRLLNLIKDNHLFKRKKGPAQNLKAKNIYTFDREQDNNIIWAALWKKNTTGSKRANLNKRVTSLESN